MSGWGYSSGSPSPPRHEAAEETTAATATGSFSGEQVFGPGRFAGEDDSEIDHIWHTPWAERWGNTAGRVAGGDEQPVLKQNATLTIAAKVGSRCGSFSWRERDFKSYENMNWIFFAFQADSKICWQTDRGPDAWNGTWRRGRGSTGRRNHSRDPSPGGEPTVRAGSRA